MPPTLVSPLTPEQASALQVSVENTYDLFTKRVAAGRGMSQDDVKKIAEGRVWVGASAVRLGLVDQIGTLEEAIADIKNEIGDSDLKVVYYPEASEDFWTMMARSGALDEARAALRPAPGAVELDAETRELLEYVARLRTLAPIQARMELMYIR